MISRELWILKKNLSQRFLNFQALINFQDKIIKWKFLFGVDKHFILATQIGIRKII
jgi:hypothetical protein